MAWKRASATIRMRNKEKRDKICRLEMELVPLGKVQGLGEEWAVAGAACGLTMTCREVTVFVPVVEGN